MFGEIVISVRDLSNILPWRFLTLAGISSFLILADKKQFSSNVSTSESFANVNESILQLVNALASIEIILKFLFSYSAKCGMETCPEALGDLVIEAVLFFGLIFILRLPLISISM